MAKFIITGDAFVVTSSHTLEELKTLEKYDPKALSLFEADEDTGKKHEVFRVYTAASGKGGINVNGAQFACVSRDGSEAASITVLLPDGVEDAKEYVNETFGPAIVKLEKVEAQLDEALAKVAADKAAIDAKITIA